MELLEFVDYLSKFKFSVKSRVSLLLWIYEEIGPIRVVDLALAVKTTAAYKRDKDLQREVAIIIAKHRVEKLLNPTDSCI